MKTVEVTIIIELPEIDKHVTKEQLYEWVHYVTGFTSSMSTKNPLVDHELSGNVQECLIVE